MSIKHNEDTRVKIPSILHLTRLGYRYLSLKDTIHNEDTNVFPDIFIESFNRINPEAEVGDAERMIQKISLALDHEDLGETFYNLLTQVSGTKLIDFENINNNSFNVVTELTCKNGDDEFRPDITLLINGIPLCFIEVKKPNNREGVLAERERIDVRSANKKFRKFINISQILVFSNNMEYDESTVEPLEGAFYASPSLKKTMFNYFREQEDLDLSKLLTDQDDKTESFVLKDNNLSSIKNSAEFKLNKHHDRPTNRIITSLFSRERLFFLLRYGITYVQEEDGIQKHIMRYPQIFATKTIERKITEGIKKGIIWHTQGSGKTALAYYNVPYLTDYFSQRGVVPKFYFIVDRLDLLTQASGEFTKRGLIVHTINSRDQFKKEFHQTKSIHNFSGKREITVINIQKFEDDSKLFKTNNYSIDLQRVYFLDEAHRSYNPKGSFLATLLSTDREAIFIGLTGTPLLKKDAKSTSIFGDYIHKYYYNASIADGYTLKLIRESIDTKYVLKMKEVIKKILEETEVIKGDIKKEELYSHGKYVEPMLDYVVSDFLKTRVRLGDNSIGGMVVCDSSPQAKKMYEIFVNKYNKKQESYCEVAQYLPSYNTPNNFVDYTLKSKKPLTASLILHDIGSKDDIKKQVEAFKAGEIDFLFVFGMLLTGFDAKRLKKLYLGRVVKAHNLLQTLTRVNRPYKNYKYGYVVDFADISREFQITNEDYFKELQGDLDGMEGLESLENIFKSKKEIEEELSYIKETLWDYDLKNAEVFSSQISQINDRKKVLEIKKALENAKALYNMIRLTDNVDLLEKTDFKKLNILFIEASNRLAHLNQLDAIENSTDTTNLLNTALENIYFQFDKVSEEEMVLADKLQNTLRKARESLTNNFDKKDPEFVNLYEEFRRIFKNRKIDEVSQEEMRQSLDALDIIQNKAKEINRTNELLRAKYLNDMKYTRIHKRIREMEGITLRDSEINQFLLKIKEKNDNHVTLSSDILANEDYFNEETLQLVIESLSDSNIEPDFDTVEFISKNVTKEYIDEYNGVVTC